MFCHVFLGLKASHSSSGIWPIAFRQYRLPRNWVYPVPTIAWLHTLQLYSLQHAFFWASGFFSGWLVVHPFSPLPVCCTTNRLWVGWTWWCLCWLHGSSILGLARSVILLWNHLWSPGLSRGSSREVSVGWKCPPCQRVLHRQWRSLNEGFDLFSACFVLVPGMICCKPNKYMKKRTASIVVLR